MVRRRDSEVPKTDHQIRLCRGPTSYTLDQDSGTVILKFESQFIFSILSIFHFPALLIKTTLTSRKVKGNLQEAEGKVINNNGEATLVGIATVPKTENIILDTLLMLPNEALAILKCKIK